MKTKILQYTKSLILIGIATAILVVALEMANAQNHWTEVIQTPTPGTKGRNAAIGAIGGGLLGGIAAFVIGGVGIVAMGTSIGTPAGVGLISVATGIGAVGGAVVGQGYRPAG